MTFSVAALFDLTTNMPPLFACRIQNTFIDDLFAFIIRMPTMARMSCFRDDVVFIIYLWQRYLYPVDTSRPAEGGGMAETTGPVQEKEKGTKEKDS